MKNLKEFYAWKELEGALNGEYRIEEALRLTLRILKKASEKGIIEDDLISQIKTWEVVLRFFAEEDEKPVFVRGHYCGRIKGKYGSFEESYTTTANGDLWYFYLPENGPYFYTPGDAYYPASAAFLVKE